MAELGALARLFVEQTLALLPWFMLAVLLGVIVSLLSLDVVARRVFRQHGVLAIACTAAIGAFSPFCSFTVIPLIRKFLRTGVPLSAVMAFWIASPSMSPEIFGMSASQLGFPIAITRLAGACVLSIGAGFLVLALERRGYLRNPLRAEHRRDSADEEAAPAPCGSPGVESAGAARPGPVAAGAPGVIGEDRLRAPQVAYALAGASASPLMLGGATVDGPPRLAPPAPHVGHAPPRQPDDPPSCGASRTAASSCSGAPAAEDDGQPWWPQVAAELRRVQLRPLLKEVWDDSRSLGKWLLIAVAIEVLILRYVPRHVVSDVLGGAGLLAFPLATVLSVPLYMNGLSAIPIVDGLLLKGMLPGAAVTFLLAGSVTTIPALVAVRAVVRGQIFWFYAGVSVLGSFLLGLTSSLWL